jgi:phosphoribosylformimino-5-aminoimidazole carboxamide ribotide isomerase
MRIIPVLDVSRGRAFHARAGEREHYQPLRSVLHEGSDPIEFARAYRDQLGCREIYVADLDGIAGGDPPLPLYRQLAALGLDLWVDPGVRSARDVERALEADAHVVVVGLETVTGPASLEQILKSFDRDRIAFSLDMRDGKPVCAPGSDWVNRDAEAIVHIAVSLGARRLVVLDLARVGSGAGVGGLEVISSLAEVNPAIDIVAGGGVAGVGDLIALSLSGATAALVASVLHDGRVTREDLDRLGNGVRNGANANPDRRSHVSKWGESL